jgi:hypothetical protein
VLVAVVEGLEGLLPHQALWQFVAGRLVDAFDTELEKYAVHKVGCDLVRGMHGRRRGRSCSVLHPSW